MNCSINVDRILLLEKRLDDVESRFDKRLAQIEERLVQQTHNVTSVEPSRPGDLVNIIKSTFEAESKRRNAVLFGVHEQDDDLEAVRNLVSNGNPKEENLKVKPSDITSVFRDGPRIPGKPRFLKVVCVTSKVQRSFIELVNKTIKLTNPDLRARPDLTWEQRDAGRKLRHKLETLEEPHKFFIDYYKLTIVDKTTRNIIFRLAGDADSA